MNELTEVLKRQGYDIGYSFHRFPIPHSKELEEDIISLSYLGYINRKKKILDEKYRIGVNVLGITKSGKLYLDLLASQYVKETFPSEVLEDISKFIDQKTRTLLQ